MNQTKCNLTARFLKQCLDNRELVNHEKIFAESYKKCHVFINFLSSPNLPLTYIECGVSTVR